MALRTGRIFATAFLVGVLACTAAVGQDTQPGNKRAAAYQQITALCRADAERFCPEVDQALASPRDQMMCLKIYRADLSLNCRRAVKAVTAANQSAP